MYSALVSVLRYPMHYRRSIWILCPRSAADHLRCLIVFGSMCATRVGVVTSLNHGFTVPKVPQVLYTFEVLPQRCRLSVRLIPIADLLDQPCGVLTASMDRRLTILAISSIGLSIPPANAVRFVKSSGHFPGNRTCSKQGS